MDQLNITKNGIPIAEKRNQVKYGKPYRAVANPHTHFITLYRKEDVPVWLVMPYNNSEVRQLLREGWRIIEKWEKKK